MRSDSVEMRIDASAGAADASASSNEKNPSRHDLAESL
jgi:hypothetical protein